MRFKNEKAGFLFFFPKWQILRCIEGSEEGAGNQKIQNKELSWRVGEGIGFPWGSQEGGEGGRQVEALCPALSLLLLGEVSLLAAHPAQLEVSLHRLVWQSLSVSSSSLHKA